MGIPDPDRDPQFYQGVPLRRFTAFVIDTVIIAVLWFVGLVVFAALTLGIGTLLAIPLFFATAFAYRWILLTQNSATLGMSFTGIEVRDATGARLSRELAALHTAAFMVSIGFLPLAIIGWFLMATSPTRQAIHDLFLGTVVINRPA